MIEPPDDELLSAYLDGELAGDERARVERLLAERPESRQLLEELRAIQHRLQSMPAARLGDDFAERVLRQAEREMLSSGEEGFRVQDSEFREPSGADGREQVFSWRRVRRPMIWASLALAAGLLVMLFDRDRLNRPQKQVAMAPQAAERQDDLRTGQLPEIGAAPARGPEAKDGAEAAPTLQVQKNGMNSVLQGGEASNLSASGSTPTSRRRMAEQLDESQDEQPAENEQKKEGRNEVLGLRDESAGEPPIVDDQTLVVWCELAPDVRSEESFSQVLAQQNIAWQPAGEEEQLGYGKLGRGERSKRVGFFAYRNESDEKAAVEVDAAQLADTLQRRGLQRTAKDQQQLPLDALQSPGAQMILVEASDAQVKAVLEALDQDRDTYRTVEVEPAPDAPRQQSLAHYSRGVPLSDAARPAGKPSSGKSKADDVRQGGRANLKPEAASGLGGMSVKNSAADMRLPQGRAMRLQVQQAIRSAGDEAEAAALVPPPPAPPALATAPPAPAGPATEATDREQPPVPVSRVLFVLVPPAEAPSKPAAAKPAAAKSAAPAPAEKE